MNRQDIESFFADEAALESEDYVIFKYLIETAFDPMEAAANLCRESSTAQWARLGVDEDFRPRHAARVVSLEPLGEESKGAVTARIRVAHPHVNFGPKIPNLMTAALGEGVFHCDGINTVKLIDIEFPQSFTDQFEGPRFGVKGMRKTLDITDRPLFFGVVKPNVGLDPRSFADIAREAWLGGLDVAKDDEMLADPVYSPFEERMKFVGKALKEAEDATGERKMFVANVTDETDRMLELSDIAVNNGINAVMVNAMAVGLSAVRLLRKNCSVPIVAHFDCIAPMSRHPRIGIASPVITKLERLCGCDVVIMPGFGARMMTPEEEVFANVAECAKRLGSIKPALPVPGGSDWAGTLPFIYSKLRTLDFGLVSGRGVFDHPMGPAAGARSLRQAWEAVLTKTELGEYAKGAPELKAAIEAFAGVEGLPTARQSDTIPTQSMLRGFTGANIYIDKH